jgi:hypothetical protein
MIQLGRLTHEYWITRLGTKFLERSGIQQFSYLKAQEMFQYFKCMLIGV